MSGEYAQADAHTSGTCSQLRLLPAIAPKVLLDMQQILSLLLALQFVVTLSRLFTFATRHLNMNDKEEMQGMQQQQQQQQQQREFQGRGYKAAGTLYPVSPIAGASGMVSTSRVWA